MCYTQILIGKTDFPYGYPTVVMPKTVWFWHHAYKVTLIGTHCHRYHFPFTKVCCRFRNLQQKAWLLLIALILIWSYPADRFIRFSIIDPGICRKWVSLKLKLDQSQRISSLCMGKASKGQMCKDIWHQWQLGVVPVTLKPTCVAAKQKNNFRKPELK